MRNEFGGPDDGLISEVFNSGGYTYICKARPGTALTEAKWLVVRFSSTGQKRYANVSSEGRVGFNNIANDYESLSYS